MLRLPRRKLPELDGLAQAGAALAVATVLSFVAGLTLGRIQGTLEALPGLLVLVPAAIGMRGNIYGALASRLGTAMHTGTYSRSRRPDTVVGQNVTASVALSLSASLGLALLAKAVAVAFGVGDSLSIFDLTVISVLAGAASSIVLLAVTVTLSSVSVSRGWDMDNVAAPLVTATADVVTLPAIAASTLAVGHRLITPVVGVLCILAAVATPVRAWRLRRPELRRVLAESAPVLLIAGALSTVAGAVFETRLSDFLSLPALLVMIPPFLASTGALGGVLTSRVASGLHLGSVHPSPWPGVVARRHMLLVAMLRIPTLVAIAILAHVVSLAADLETPGIWPLLAVAAVAGAITMAATLVIAWYGSIGAYRLGLDPDNHGIPLVTSAMDLFGAAALVIAIATVGL